MATPLDHVGSCTGGNTIPLDDEGRTYHFACKRGEVANHILICSDYLLAEEISKLMDDQEHLFKRVSNRGYVTYTGTFKGKRMSIIAFGIGFAMIDFLMRELRAITSGPLVFIQIGSAATPLDIKLGTPIIIQDACAYEINYEDFDNQPYTFYRKAVPADSRVVAAIEAGLKTGFVKGRVASNPSFSAGVAAPTLQSGGVGVFDFKTCDLMKKLNQELGEIATLEMDTYPLYWTALRATEKNTIATGAVSIAGSNLKGDVLPYDEIHKKLMEVAPVLLEVLGSLQ